MVAGVGLFVGLSDFSGGVKTITVLILALTLYGAGLAMYRHLKKLRPAAVTLTSIGLICLPLTGVAAHLYAASSLGSSWIWFLTSFVSLAFYTVALLQMRQSLIGYMSVFMCLSLWLSIASVIQAPLYFFGWAMIVLGMLYLLAVRYLKLWHEVEVPLSVSATVMVPTALILTLMFGYPTISIVHQSITVLLAGAFYALGTLQERGDKLRLTYFILANSLAPLGVYMLAADWTHSAVVSAWIVYGVTVIQIVLAGVWRSLHRTWHESALVVTATTLIISTLLAMPLINGSWAQFAWLLCFVMVLSAVVALWSRNVLYAMLSFATMVILPTVVGYLVNNPHWDAWAVSGWYAGLSALLLFSGRWLRRFDFIELSRSAYAFALFMAWTIGLSGQHWVPMTASLVVGLLGLAISSYERAPKATYIGTTLFAVATVQGLLWLDATWQHKFAFIVSILGLSYYAAHILLRKLKAPQPYIDPWLVSGLITLYAGALVGLVVNGINWSSIAFLGIAGLLTGHEAFARKHIEGIYVGAAVAHVALQLMLYKLGVREWQLYWYMWALYVLVVTYIQREVMGIVAVAMVTGGGLAAGLYAHGLTDLTSISIISSFVAAGFYLVGKLHLFLPDRKRWEPFIEAWSLTGLGGLYLMASLPFWLNVIASGGSTYTWNALILMLAGALTCYEAYVKRSRGGIYLGAGISLVGLEWLLYTQHIHNIQVYTHLWIAYFAVLAWLGYRDKRDDEKQMFTVLALTVQTVPLAWQALAGDQGLGLVLLLESIAVLLVGLWIRYPLVAWWGLSAAVGSVLYQLRAYQFFVLVLLGAGVIALGVYTLVKQDKKS